MYSGQAFIVLASFFSQLLNNNHGIWLLNINVKLKYTMLWRPLRGAAAGVKDIISALFKSNCRKYGVLYKKL